MIDLKKKKIKNLLDSQEVPKNKRKKNGILIGDIYMWGFEVGVFTRLRCLRVYAVSVLSLKSCRIGTKRVS